MEEFSIIQNALADLARYKALAERLSAGINDANRVLDDARRLNAGYREQIKTLSQEIEARDLCISLLASRLPSAVKSAKIEVASTWRGDRIPFIRRAGDMKAAAQGTGPA